MKLLVVMQHVNFFRNLETVVRELDARGHETVMLHGTKPDPDGAKPKMAAMGRGIEEAEAELRLTSGYRPLPEEKWQRALRKGRMVINRGVYFYDAHPSPERAEGLDKLIPKGLRRVVNTRAGRAVLGRTGTLRAWRRFELAARPSPTITALIRKVDPDVVLVSPSVWPKSPVEADYILAARKLGIPTIGYLNSWDNLTSKGTVQVLPDVFVVWNEALATEADEIHQIPREIIRVTGAPHTDHFFDMSASTGRAELCRRIGCPDDRPYVVYLCSSRTLIGDETPIVTRLADALRQQLGDGAPTVMVRPHPVNPTPWDGYDHPGTAVYPRQGDQADTPASWQDYFDQLTYASGFVGLNTTAFLEAAVADHPCMTIVSDEFFEQQGRTGHFRHLLDADFLEVSRNVGELVSRIERVLDGADEKADGRRRFVEAFLRPRGVERPAREVVADLIEELGVPSARTLAPATDAQPQPLGAAAGGGGS